MKIHVPCMLAIGIDKHTTNTQVATMALLNIRALWLRKLISHNGLEKQDRDVYREKSILMIAWCPALSNLS